MYLVYAGQRGHAFIDRALYLPKSWTGDPDRMAEAGVPADVEFATKPALARTMIARALDAGVPAGWVAGDEVYGADPQLRNDLHQRKIGYVLAVASNHRVSTAAGTATATELARKLPARAWHRRSCGAGAKIRCPAITTDIIVGFPGETEADFEETLRVVAASRFAGAFTFQYFPRPGTPAADLPPLPKPVVQERYERLVALQDAISYEGMQEQVGRTVEVLVSAGEGRKDESGRLTGRARDNRLVHLAGAEGVRPGDVITTVITRGAPHYLLAEGPLLSHRRTAAGDAFEGGRRLSTPGVSLGLPTVGVPAPLPALSCG